MKCPTCGDLRAEFFSINFWTCPVCDAPKSEEPTLKESAGVIGDRKVMMMYSVGLISVDELDNVGIKRKAIVNPRRKTPAGQAYYEAHNIQGYSWIITTKTGHIVNGGQVMSDNFPFPIAGIAGISSLRSITIDHVSKRLELSERRP